MAENESWRQIVRRAWAEPAFKQRLLNQTHDVLREYQITIPDGVTFHVVEDSHSGDRYLVLPPEPIEGTPRVDDFGRDVESGDPGF